MIDFKFIINKKYLFLHAFRHKLKISPEWVHLHNKVWKIDKDVYNFLIGHPEAIISNRSLKQLSTKADKIIVNILHTKEFKKTHQETECYKKWISKQWSRNKININSILKRILKIDIPKIKFKVFLTHPRLTNGHYLGNYKICWGHPEEWRNYSVVYLIHETFHEILKNNSRLMHAIIELAADNQLRIKLNKKGKYFDIKGHKELKKIEKILYPYWIKYLKDKEKNIFEFFEEIKKIKIIQKIK
ncbi:MAG: hypothetical protein AAB396_02380 [Patescibacteria group bacterium]